MSCRTFVNLVAFAATLTGAGAAQAPAGESWVERAGKLNSIQVGRNEAKDIGGKEERDTRNKLSMRRIRPRKGTPDWDTDPTAIPFMLYQVDKRTGLPVHINNEGLDVGSDALFEELIVYLTSHEGWSFDEKETENLSTWLKRGGTLLLDDCYNKGSPFTDSVAPEVGKMIPGSKPTMMVESDTGVADAFKMIYQTVWPGAGLVFRSWQYFLLDGRPAVFFTPNDDGCGWEISTPPTASNPIGEGIGHGGDNGLREVFYKLITNWMMFAYSH